MATIINTNTNSFVTDVLMGYNVVNETGGRFYLDGNMVNVELSQTIAEVMYINEIFRDGLNVTGRYTTNTERNGATRVMLDTPFQFSSRSLAYGARKGTTGNAGIFNMNAPLLPANEEFMIYRNQVNDQGLYFPDLSKEYLPLDIVSRKIASLAKSVTQDRSGSIIAEILLYNIWRALNGGDNLISGFDRTTDNAYGNLIAQVNTVMDNGDAITGAFTYPLDGRCIIGRPDFINGIFSKNSGVILNGNDLAQRMLQNYDLDGNINRRDYVGTNYKGKFGQIDFVSAPDYLWTIAEMYCHVPKGSFDHIKAIAVSREATATAISIDLGTKIVDMTNGKRGVEAQPLHIWGMEAFRKSVIIGDTSFNGTDSLTAMGFTPTERRYPIAPNNQELEEYKLPNAKKDTIVVPIHGLDGTITDYREIAAVPRPNGDNIQSGLPRVQPIKADPAPGEFTDTVNVTLSTVTDGAEIYYTTDGTIPTSASTKYSAPVAMTATTTLSAIATKDGMQPSEIFSGVYTKKAATK